MIDATFSLVVEANPVPDPAVAADQLDADREVLAMLDERAEAQSRDLPEMGPLGRVRQHRWAGAWAFAVAISGRRRVGRSCGADRSSAAGGERANHDHDDVRHFVDDDQPPPESGCARRSVGSGGL